MTVSDPLGGSATVEEAGRLKYRAIPRRRRKPGTVGRGEAAAWRPRRRRMRDGWEVQVESGGERHRLRGQAEAADQEEEARAASGGGGSQEKGMVGVESGSG